MIRIYKRANAHRRKLMRIAVVFSALLLFAVSAVQFWIGFGQAREWVLHTFTVKDHLQLVLADLVNMETGQRGYMLTGEPLYLQPYRESMAAFEVHVARLKDLMSDNPSQLDDLRKIEQLARRKITELKDTVDLMAAHRAPEALAIVKTNAGLEFMEQLRNRAAIMQETEQKLLEARLFKLKRYYIYTFAIVGGILVIALTLVWQLFLLLTALEAKESELQSMNNELEERVHNRTEQLMKSNQELERFTYVSSHDLQEPLRKIALFAQLLHAQHSSKMEAEAVGHLSIIAQSATRMQNLIRDLLDYSRLDHTPSVFQDVDLQKVLTDVVADLEVAIRDHKAVVQFENLPTVRGNATHVHQLFQNLVGNAIKFHAPNVPPLIRVTAKSQDGHWQFSVQDNGIGIDKKYAEKIFKPFQRLHHKNSYPGTGIGLAICKKIVEEHNGRIWVSASPENGSTFHFTFNTAKPAFADAAI